MGRVVIDGATVVIPNGDSPCAAWQTFFKQLKRLAGADNARMLWLTAWAENGDGACAADPAFAKWLAKNKVDVSNPATRAVADLGQIGANFLGLGKNLTKALSVGTPLLLGATLLAILAVLYNTAKNSDAMDVAAVLPQGKAAKGLKLLSKQ